MTSDAKYFAYLKSRRLRSLLYRRLWLYPHLRRHLSGRVLDVGCGIGDFLASSPGSIGVDINPLSVNWCRLRGYEVRLMERGRIPFPDNSFDSVVLDNVLEHLADPTPLLAEIRRVHFPGGTLIVGVPGPCGYAIDPDHKTFYDEQSLMRVLNAAGFRCAMVMHMPLRSEWLSTRMRQYCLYAVFHRYD